MICVETAMSGHLLEPLAICTVLAALLLVHMSPFVPRRVVAASLLLALGAGLKLLPLLLAIPMGCALKRHRLLFFGVVATAALALLMPMFLSGAHGIETLDAFARRWEGNAGFFRVIKNGAVHAIGALYGATDPESMIHLRVLDAPARLLQPTFFALHKDGAYDPAFPGAFPLIDIALAVARAFSALIVAGAVIVGIRRNLSPMAATALVVAAGVIAAPVLHPWYILWLLALAAVFNYRGPFVFACVLPLSYLSLDHWWRHGVWLEYPAVLAIEYAILALVVVVHVRGIRPSVKTDGS
jgi:hypothetical protein